MNYFEKRAKEKQAARQRDMDAITNGTPTKEIRDRNFMFSGMDFSKVVAIDQNGNRFHSL